MVRQHIYAGRGVAGKIQWQREAGLEVALNTLAKPGLALVK